MTPIEKTYTVHLPFNRSNNQPPIMTLVFSKGQTLDTYKVGIAICNPKDSFSKKLGRAIAYGRMEYCTNFNLYWTRCQVLGAIDRVAERREIWNVLYEDAATVLATLADRMKNK